MNYIRKKITLSLLLASSTSLWAGEKAYLHLDNSAYFLGDTLRLAAYVMDTDTKRLSEKSKVLYVELLAPEGYVVESRTYPLVNGRCAGDFYLRPLLLSGLFEVRAYTRYMQNDGEDNYYSQVVPIYEQVENGKYSSLVMRKRTTRNAESIKCKRHKGMVCLDWAQNTTSNIVNNKAEASHVTYACSSSSPQPYGLVTFKLKGQPGTTLSLSIVDEDNYVRSTQEHIIEFTNGNFLSSDNKPYGINYAPEKNITIYGKAGKLVKASDQKISFEPMPNQQLSPILFFPTGYSEMQVSTNQLGKYTLPLGCFTGDAFLQLKYKNLSDSSLQTRFVVNDDLRPAVRKYTKPELALQKYAVIDGKKVTIKQKSMGKTQFSAIHLDLIEEIDKLRNEDENALPTEMPSLLQACGLLAEKYPCKSLKSVGAIETGTMQLAEQKIPNGYTVNNFTNIKNYKEVVIRSDNSIRQNLAPLASLFGMYTPGHTMTNAVGYDSFARYPSIVCCLIPDTNHEWDKYVKYNLIPHTRFLKVTGFSPVLPFRMPNYSKSHPLSDYRRTLYWNPDLQLDENGEATIQFYNNGTCKKLYLSVEGMTEDGRAIVLKNQE